MGGPTTGMIMAGHHPLPSVHLLSLHVIQFPRPYPSYCKQPKTGGGNGLGMTLQSTKMHPTSGSKIDVLAAFITSMIHSAILSTRDRNYTFPSHNKYKYIDFMKFVAQCWPDTIWVWRVWVEGSLLTCLNCFLFEPPSCIWSQESFQYPS